MKFVIGDIHGEISKLKNLINNIQSIDTNCELIFIGDYINKGEDSRKTLDYLKTLDNSIFLMGNHEYYFLEFLKNNTFKDKIVKYAKDTTFKDFNMTFNNIKEALYIPYKSFFDNLQFYYETDKYFISHAGIETSYIDKNICDVPLEKFILNNRYDFIKSDCKINGKISIFGHTGFIYPYVDDVKIGIDTSAVYDKENRLTAFCIDKEFFLSDHNEKTFLKIYKKDICPIIIRKQPYRDEVI